MEEGVVDRPAMFGLLLCMVFAGECGGMWETRFLIIEKLCTS
jgi:hypothetical protein